MASPVLTWLVVGVVLKAHQDQAHDCPVSPVGIEASTPGLGQWLPIHSDTLWSFPYVPKWKVGLVSGPSPEVNIFIDPSAIPKEGAGGTVPPLTQGRTVTRLALV